jgi:hypothetical protein
MSWLVPMNRDDTKWSASRTLLLLHKPLSAQSSCVLHEVGLIALMLHGMRLPFSHLMHLIPPENVCTLLKVNINCLYAVLSLIFLLLVFHGFLEPYMHFASKMDFGIYDSFIFSNESWTWRLYLIRPVMCFLSQCCCIHILTNNDTLLLENCSALRRF